MRRRQLCQLVEVLGGCCSCWDGRRGLMGFLSSIRLSTTCLLLSWFSAKGIMVGFTWCPGFLQMVSFTWCPDFLQRKECWLLLGVLVLCKWRNCRFYLVFWFSNGGFYYLKKKLIFFLLINKIIGFYFMSWFSTKEVMVDFIWCPGFLQREEWWVLVSFFFFFFFLLQREEWQVLLGVLVF